MEKENQYKPFEIICRELGESSLLECDHYFFEFVYIISGTGMQSTNNNVTGYRPGDMFMLTPEGCHSFAAHSISQFLLIKFNDIYMKSKMLHSDTVRQLRFILGNAGYRPGCILQNQKDRELVRLLINMIIKEYPNSDLYRMEIVNQLVNTLILISARNIVKLIPGKISSCAEKRVLDILQYIQSNIYYPEKLRTKAIAGHFGISEFYLGRYFKKHLNETLQQYIINYRMKLVETRLQHSNLRLNEIAYELGFTDESHMGKLFRKYHHVSPKEFRQRYHADKLNPDSAIGNSHTNQ